MRIAGLLECLLLQVAIWAGGEAPALLSGFVTSSGEQYTEYPGVGHNSWDNAYGTKEAIDWLLAQSR